MARILLVEDDPEVLLVFEQVLRDEAYEVDTSETFSGGRDHLELRHYDLLITDGRLPDGTGLGLADIAHGKSIPALIVRAIRLACAMAPIPIWPDTRCCGSPSDPTYFLKRLRAHSARCCSRFFWRGKYRATWLVSYPRTASVKVLVPRPRPTTSSGSSPRLHDGQTLSQTPRPSFRPSHRSG